MEHDASQDEQDGEDGGRASTSGGVTFHNLMSKFSKEESNFPTIAKVSKDACGCNYPKPNEGRRRIISTPEMLARRGKGIASGRRNAIGYVRLPACRREQGVAVD